MKNILLLISLCLLFVLFLISSFVLYKRNKEGNYSFLTMFPYEMKSKEEPFLNLVSRLLLGASVIIMCYFSVDLLYYHSSKFTCRALSFIIILNAIFLLGLFLLDMSSYKIHIVLISLFYVFNFLSFVTFGYWGLIDPFKVYPLYIIIISFVIAFLILGSMFTPLLNNWWKLKKSEKGGENDYSRGKIFILSFVEWVNIFLFLTLFFLLVLGAL